MPLRPLAAGALVLAAVSAGTAAQETDSPLCDNKPVYMVVSGETLDGDRMREYGIRLAQSGIYAELGGYYINTPRPVAVFEGDVPANHATLIVRFPCLENARRFWYSQVYQETIKPIRLNPSAGDYTVTVYSEGDLPSYMEGAVSAADYLREFDASKVPQLQDSP